MIVGTGVSGVIVLLPASIQSGIPCGIIRKPLDAKMSSYEGGSHSSHDIETLSRDKLTPVRYVIIDDLVDSGRTIQRIKDTMTKEYAHPDFAGVILYGTDGFYGSRIKDVYSPCSDVTEEIELVEVCSKTTNFSQKELMV
jgi:adenine/guanine phosphoribosyltransferase-like PRPP-binding protein